MTFLRFPALAVAGLITMMAPSPIQAQPRSGQTLSAGTEMQPRRVALGTRITAPPAIDGVLDEGIWQQAKPLTEFTQTEPGEGLPATEKTEVRLLFDDKYLYVGVVCYDAEPSQIVVTDSRRDSSLSESDSFQMIFDTYHDLQNGFVFGTNAAGIQYDAQVRGEGQTGSGGGGGAAFGAGRTQTGSGGGRNVNWDGVWDVKSRVTEVGWIAEFRIAFRTLRYGPPPQIWGVNFSRNIQHKRELVYWSPLGRQYDINRLSSAGELRDLDVKPPRNLKISPYAISTANRNFTPASQTDVNKDWGADLKYGVTPSMNLDLTYNTDFAQVEVDEQQINLTRFNLVFPEKRPFFSENAGLFAVGRSGDVDLFFSRRIGISDDGSLVPIRGGARLTGKTGAVNLGLLNIQTDEVPGALANNFTAARVSQELPNRSSLGAIFTGRVATGTKANSGNWNRAWGVDGKLGVGTSLTFSGFAAKTETPGRSGRTEAYHTGLDYRDRRHRTYLEYGEVGEDFNPEVGFLRRPGGFRRVAAGFFETLRSDAVRNKGFRELLPHVTYVRYSTLSGGIQTGTLHMDNHLDWANGNFIAPGINIDWEGLDVPFEVYPGVVVPPGVYRSVHTAYRMNTDQRKWLSGSFDWDYGGFLSGHQNSTSPALTIRQGGTFNASVRWSRSAIDLPQGAFTTNLGTFRTTYNFTTSLYVQDLIQYNDRTKRWSTNLRFSWLDAAGTGLFLVYNDTEGLNGLGPINRAFIVKYTRLVDVLR